MKKMLVALTLIAMVIPLYVGNAEPAEASHVPAQYACEYFKPHTGDQLVSWTFQQAGTYGGRYRCRARHYTSPSTYYDHVYCVYHPGPPPDDSWAWGAC